MSTASDQKSATMWCADQQQTCSRGERLKQVDAQQRACSRSKGRWASLDQTFVELVLAPAVAPRRRKADLGLLSDVLHGSPCAALKVVRRAAWRSTSAWKAARSAATSSRDVTRSATDDVVGRALGRELVQEPERLLAVRERLFGDAAPACGEARRAGLARSRPGASRSAPPARRGSGSEAGSPRAGRRPARSRWRVPARSPQASRCRSA